MIQKMLSGILVLLLVVGMLPLALAEEDTTNTVVDTEVDDETSVDEETQEEAEAMVTTHGAEMRLLQLERVLTLNILRGKEVVAKIQEEGTDTTELELILDEFEALKEEVQNVDPAADDAVQVFVELKKDGIELTKQFRDLAKTMLDSEKRNDLREHFKEFKENEGLKALSEKIHENRKRHNEKRMGDLFTKLGLENKEDLLDKMKNARSDLKDVRQVVKDRLKEMAPEEKKEAFSDMKRSRIQRAVGVRAKIDSFKEHAFERKEDRLEKRMGRLEQSPRDGPRAEALKKHQQQRFDKLQKAKDHFEQKKMERKDGGFNKGPQQRGQQGRPQGANQNGGFQ